MRNEEYGSMCTDTSEDAPVIPIRPDGQILAEPSAIATHLAWLVEE
jgi:hypothetical protein